MRPKTLAITLCTLVAASLSSCGWERAEDPPAPSPEPAADPEMEDPDATDDRIAIGKAFYEANSCGACHTENGDAFDAPSLIGLDADTLLMFMDGTVSHSGGLVGGVTLEDAEALVAFLDQL